MFKSKIPYIFAKITNFLCILRQFCLQYKTIQRFCKTWLALNFNFILIMKFNLENRIFYLCPNVAGFLKNVFKRQIRAHYKKKNWRTSILRWLGRESVQNVTRTRKWGGSHSTPRWAEVNKLNILAEFPSLLGLTVPYFLTVKLSAAWLLRTRFVTSPRARTPS